MDKIVRIITITMLCTVCLIACAASSSKPVAVWEANPVKRSTPSPASAPASIASPDSSSKNTPPSTAQLDAYPRKTGNPYVIRGVTYYPLQDVSAGYEEIGIASWYGADFHDKKTANGETYDMQAFTAAHKTLPMPTFVRVENLDNGKEAVVRINDRGPFSKGRIIDLSYAAAQQIGMTQTGTAKVKITVLSESTDHMRTEGKDVDINNGRFALQLGAYADKKNADNLASQFTDSAILPVDIDNRTLYRVRIRGYQTKTAAENALRTYEKEFPGAFVISE